MKNSRKKINNMYVCPKCEGRPQIKFGVGKRNESGYPITATVLCSQCSLSTSSFEFTTLGDAQNRWNIFVDNYTE